MLHIIPTPIGNIDDITIRGHKMLTSLSLLICEDTRSTKKLLTLLNIDYSEKTFHSLTSFTKEHQLTHYLDLVRQHEVGLVSDAGTPGLSDPGKILIKLCTENHVPFSILPGANALVPAVIASGFDTSDFRFVGFIPKKKGKQTMIKEIISSPFPVFFYESVHRIEKTLLQFQELGYKGKVSIARELTKMHEQFVTDHIEAMITMIQSGNMVIKGEFVVGMSPSDKNL